LTLTGVAWHLNDRTGDSATRTGDGAAGDLFTGDIAGWDRLAGVSVMSDIFCGDMSAGKSETLLLKRLVDRLSSFLSSTLCVASSGSVVEGTSNSIRGCKA